MSLIATGVRNGTSPAISADGRFVAYEKNNFVYLWDGQLETAILASLSSSGSPMTNTAGISQPVITPAGSKILFLSSDSRTEGPVQLYARDWQEGTTWLASATTNGALAEI